MKAPTHISREEEERDESTEENWLYCQFPKNFKAITIANGFGDCPGEGGGEDTFFPSYINK
jgi:hypothetical protein